MPGPLALRSNPSLVTLLAAGAVLGLVVSTRYLCQPFVWANWPVDEVLAEWLEVLRDRLVIGVSMAVALWIALRRGAPHGPGIILRSGLMLFVGAACGELALMALAVPDAAVGPLGLAGRLLRWAAFVAVIAVLYWLRESRQTQDVAQQSAQRRRQETDSQLQRMRLLALRAQIEPHFLFNTLATVQRLTQIRRESGALLLDHLIRFVRLSTAAGPDDATWTIAQEMDLVQAYLGVIEMRLDGRLRVAIEVDEGAAGISFPPLLLATLVENAVKHGITPAPEGGQIDIRVTCDAACLHAEVRDTGVGFVGQSGSGIGLANSRARLRTLYGSAARLYLVANAPQGVIATLSLPLDGARTWTQ